jgi:hypothetical protein
VVLLSTFAATLIRTLFTHVPVLIRALFTHILVLIRTLFTHVSVLIRALIMHVSVLIMTLFVHITMLIMTLFVHITMLFPPSTFRTEVLSPVVIPISSVGAILAVAKCMYSSKTISTEFGRKFPSPYPYPIAAVIGGAVPAAPPEDEVGVVEVKHVIGYADSHPKAQSGRIEEVGWLRDDNLRSSHIDAETNVRLSH